MEYKMIVTDLDGTLLNDSKDISDENIDTLKDLDARGVKIVVATGRNYYMAKHLIDKISFLNPVILANNGSVVRSSADDALLERNCLDSDTFMKIYECGLRYGLHPMLHVDEYDNGYDMMYDDEKSGRAYMGSRDLISVRAVLKPFVSENLSHILSVCYRGSRAELADFMEETESFNGGSFNFICNGNIGERLLIEFLHVDGCKWKALRKYIGMTGVLADEIVAFGDDNNDIEMLLNVGLGIAMKNGTEQCRLSAKRVSQRDNNDSGVAYELKNLFNF